MCRFTLSLCLFGKRCWSKNAISLAKHKNFISVQVCVFCVQCKKKQQIRDRAETKIQFVRISRIFFRVFFFFKFRIFFRIFFSIFFSRILFFARVSAISTEKKTFEMNWKMHAVCPNLQFEMNFSSNHLNAPFLLRDTERWRERDGESEMDRGLPLER